MFTISKKYAEQIKQVCSVASPRSAIQAFENVFISATSESVTLKAGDSLIELSRTIIPESFESGFETTVNAAKFLQAFNACPGDVTLIQKDDLTIKSGRTKFTLPTVSPESYPAYQDVGDVVKIDVEPSNLVRSIKKVSFAAGRDDARAFLNGVHLGESIAAANGHALAVIDGFGGNAIIPITAVAKMPDDGCAVFVSENVFCIEGDDFIFKTKLIDYSYPDYKRAIQQTTKVVTVLREDLLSATKSAAITANQKFKTVTFEFGKDLAKVSSTSESKKEKSNIEFDADCSESFVFSVNSSYLIDALNAIESDSVKLEFSEHQMQIKSEILIVIQGVRV